MVAQILIAQGQSIDTLRQQLRHTVRNIGGIPIIPETLCQAWQQIQSSIRFAQQQRSAVGGHRPTVEMRHDFPTKMRCELEPVLVTLCHSNKAVSFGSHCWCGNSVMPDRTAFCYSFVKNYG